MKDCRKENSYKKRKFPAKVKLQEIAGKDDKT